MLLQPRWAPDSSQASAPSIPPSVELANVEALAEDYEIGSPGTNWKEYEITCEITSSSGWDFGIWGNKDEKTYTAKVKVCGYGSGSCLSPAGC